ncbi:hypothetical protein AV530_002470 [Patagioenas fasciata monilis]|uniref:Uncharacterized protein n=1 Tax=Patagioenas fasciata monilis TaxID=372326 RepID=A0A1V4K6R9_PATFA|nr:hypothetical protein AV530_002470 [Patagioenas fasciata monilis]
MMSPLGTVWFTGMAAGTIFHLCPQLSYHMSTSKRYIRWEISHAEPCWNPGSTVHGRQEADHFISPP